jgi:beta-glucosidase
VPDQPRIRYLDSHLRAVHDAITAGVDVRGYLVWSLIDNFEWAEGFRQRFGLVHVDFETQKRTPKASFAWFRDFIAAQP